MTTMTIPRLGGPPETTLSGPLTALRGLYRALTRAARIRRGRKDLMSLPDHLLHDIGISRSEIDAVAEFGRPRAARW